MTNRFAALGQRPALRRKGAGDVTLTWHWIGEEGDPWPAWLRTTYKRSCGVYAIKENGRVAYVGSSRQRLYDTITRHFQQWKRSKQWWKGLRGEGHDPGLTYKRAKCQIAVMTCACGDELVQEAKLIERLRPRDNLVANPDGLDEVPF